MTGTKKHVCLKNPCLFPGKGFFIHSLCRRIALVLLFCSLSLPAAGQAKQRFYSIQLGAYQGSEAAAEAVQLLQNLGHDAFMRKEQDRDQAVWYRVYVERFPSRRQAEQEARNLKELGLISQYIIKKLEADEKAPPAGPSSPPSPARSNEVYFLHLSSYKSKENADRDVKTLEGRGYKAFMVPEEVGGEEWFRVYVGEYADEEEARRAGQELKAKGLTAYFKPIQINKKTVSPEAPQTPKPAKSEKP